MTTPAQALSNQGFCNGIDFTADGVVNVADAAKNRIGTSTIPASPAADGRAVSVRTGAAAMGNPDGRGTLNFSVDATVEGRVGDAVTQANADNTRRIFKATPSGRLNLIRIGSSGSTATPTVTFDTPPKGFVFDRTKDRSAEISRSIREGIGVGGVGAKRLQFETDGTVVLAEQSTHSFPTHYDIDQVLTQMNGQGSLILKNNNSAVFRGTIGAPGKKLKSVTLSSDLISNPLVTILGDIYANTIWLNNRTTRVDANPNGLLRLSGSGFDTPQPADPYIVDADIKTRFNTRGTFEIYVGANYDLRGQIGDASAELINVNTQPNATAIVHKDIYSQDVYIYSKSTLTVQKPLTISGRLTVYNRSSVSRGLIDTLIRGGTTLALGNHTLSVKGAVGFTNDAPGNPHTLSLILDGAGSGQLDASAGGVTLSSGTNPLNIRVNVPDPGSIANGQSFILIKGNASFSASFLSKINLITPANSLLDFALSARGNDLVLTATRSRQVLGAGTPASGAGLSARGQVNGLRFDADARVNVADGETIGALGGDMISISTGNATRGAVVFTGARASVEGRIGGVLNEVKMFAGRNDTVFKAMAPDSRLKLIQIGSSGSSATPRVTFKVPPRPVSMADPFAVEKALGLGNISAQMLNFASDGTVVLEQPPGHRYPAFYAIDTITHTGAKGTGKGALIFRGVNPTHFRGAIGEPGKPLRSVMFNSRPSRAIFRLLGDIYAQRIALNDRTTGGRDGVLSLGGNQTFGPPLMRRYTVDAPIVTHFDTFGILQINDGHTWHLRQPIGAPGARLKAVDIRNTMVILDGPVYAADVDLLKAKATFRADIAADVALRQQAQLIVDKADLAISGTLDLNNSPAAGASVALGRNTLTAAAVNFNDTGPHLLSLTLGGASNGQLVATGAITLSSGLHIHVDVENRAAIWNGRPFTIMRGTTPFPAAALAAITVESSAPGLDFVVSRGGPSNTHLLLRATRVRAVANPAVPVAAERGDLALVPYYTVAGDWVTGLHIVNTSKHTQVVKLRFRRATDAMDVLDFNVVMSPKDVYAGFLSRDDANGRIAWSSSDTSCTAPTAQGNRLEMPEIYRAHAQTGYVEIIAMGRVGSEDQPLARAAKHAVSGAAASASFMPLDCAAVRSNFFPDGSGAVAGRVPVTVRPGVENEATTWQAASSAAAIKNGGLNTYVDSGNVLKVSYFIRDNATGIEFGDNAVHIRDFLANPALTNQQQGVFSGDLNGFDFPDLNGGVPLSSGATAPIQRGRFNALRAPDALGVDRIVNEWSVNPANGVEMNWVVTLPGQYVMLKLPQYLASLAGTGRPWAPTLSSTDHQPLTNPACPRNPIAARVGAAAVAECDYRDMPVELTFTAYTREEGSSAGAEPQLVVSPALPGAREKTYLAKAVNVITFGQSRVFGGGDVDVSAPNLGQPYGWVSARVTSRDTDLRVCDWDFNDDIGAGFGAAAGAALRGKLVCSAVTPGSRVPVIGFAAWSRKVAANPDASYGRIVEHSYR